MTFLYFMTPDVWHGAPIDAPVYLSTVLINMD